MPDDDAMETEEAQGVDEFLHPGQLNDFLLTLTEAQRELWRGIRRAWKAEVRKARAERGTNTRDELYNAFQAVKGKITAAKLEKLIDNAIEKGDAQMMRVLAMLAGEDLTERPMQQNTEGAQLIIIEPHPKEINAGEPSRNQSQAGELPPGPT